MPLSAARPAAVEGRRRLLAELVGTGALVAVVVGSGIAAERLAQGEPGLQLLANAAATALALAVLVVVLGPVSGAHLNPLVTVALALTGRFPPRRVAGYLAAQAVGAAAGTVLANLMFDLDPLQVSGRDRLTPGHLLGEIVATAGLLAVVLVLGRTGRDRLAAPAVAGWIGAAYWFTSSTSFANPAVTLGRVLSDTFAGIAPASAAGFAGAQVVGAFVGTVLAITLVPGASAVPARSDNPEGVLPR